jgi:hypothetical protein
MFNPVSCFKNIDHRERSPVPPENGKLPDVTEAVPKCQFLEQARLFPDLADVLPILGRNILAGNGKGKDEPPEAAFLWFPSAIPPRYIAGYQKVNSIIETVDAV